jgi:hypothetical protein
MLWIANDAYGCGGNLEQRLDLRLGELLDVLAQGAKIAHKQKSSQPLLRGGMRTVPPHGNDCRFQGRIVVESAALWMIERFLKRIQPRRVVACAAQLIENACGRVRGSHESDGR